MLKLQQQGLQFYATTDGNEFVVPEHLDEEVREIVRRRGRVNLDILPQLLNLGLDTIESRLTTITSRSGLILHRRNLFSESYMRLLISNLRQKIRLEGRVEL